MDGATALYTGIVTALRAQAGIGTTIKAYENAAPPKVATVFPYIIMYTVSGGLTNDSPHDVMDVEVAVTAVDDTSSDAKDVAALIESALKNKTLTFPDGWVSWSTVRQTDIMSRMINVNNAQYHQYGHYYRFRITKAKG